MIARDVGSYPTVVTYGNHYDGYIDGYGGYGRYEGYGGYDDGYGDGNGGGYGDEYDGYKRYVDMDMDMVNMVNEYGYGHGSIHCDIVG